MNSVRGFVGRLSSLVERAHPGERRPSFHQRRIVVPAAGRFSLDKTILRTQPIEPVVPFARPGSPSEVAQVLEWLDVPGVPAQSAFSANDLGVDLAAILALATGRRVVFANEVPLSLEGANWTAFLEVGHSIDGELYGPVAPLLRDRFVKVAKAVVGLPEEAALALGNAIRMRNAACCLVDSDH